MFSYITNPAADMLLVTVITIQNDLNTNNNTILL